MSRLAIYDTETNGLLQPKMDKGVLTPPMDRVHTVTLILIEGASRRLISAADQPGYEKGKTGRGWERMGIVDALRLLETADVRVAFNGQDFDEGVPPLVPGAITLVYPWWTPKPGSRLIDPLFLSRLIYPDIHNSGPNKFSLPPFLRSKHSLKAWGLRLGIHKGDYSGGWANWSEDMQEYGEQDTLVLEKVFQWMMAQKPSAEASGIEHDFAAIIRRQERRGFGFDEPKALTLLAELRERQQTLEAELIAAFGEWWAYGKAVNSAAQTHITVAEEDDEDEEDEEVQAARLAEFEKRQEWGAVVIPTVTRRTKMLDFPDVTLTRLSPKTGKALKPYVGPPLCEFTQGHPYTPIKRVQFNPRSRTHIYQRLKIKYKWKPTKLTKGGKNAPPQPKVDDDVLRGLPYPEAQRLADYYLVAKRIGALADGRKAWMKASRVTELPNGERRWRIHGRVNTNGAATGRCTHMDPNMAQVPKNTAAAKLCSFPEVQGYRCRDLFIAADPYGLVGFDGSSLELRMLAHYVKRWDNGQYADIVDKGKKEDGSDPHSWMRTEIVGEDVIGSGDEGRDNAKTAIYAYLYGGGDEKIGAIVLPTAGVNEKKALGREIKQKLESRFHALGKLKEAIEEVICVECRPLDPENPNGKKVFFATKPLTGLDGRKLNVRHPHAALNTLLQSAGAIVMKQTLIVLDAELRAVGLCPGTDYEFVANIHDEAQAEVLPEHYPMYQRLALEAHPKAGTLLRVQCPLRAEVSPLARSWKETH